MTDYADQAPPRRQYDNMPETAGEDKSIGEAMGDVTRDLSLLVQQELALAKAEVSQTATRAGQTAGMFAGAAVAAVLVRGLLVARPVGGNQRPDWAWLGGGHRGCHLAGGRRGALLGCPRPNEEDQRDRRRRPRLCAKFRTHSKDTRRETYDYQQRPR